MGKLRVLSGDDVCVILSQHGFKNIRQRGSHVIMQRVDDEGATTIPVPLHRELRRGTLGAIIRQSGLSRLAFEE